jgi:hypothetical protein
VPLRVSHRLLSISVPCILLRDMRVLLLLQVPGSYQSHRSVGWGNVLACSGLVFHRTLDYLGDWGGMHRLRCSSQSQKRVPVRNVFDCFDPL